MIRSLTGQIRRIRANLSQEHRLRYLTRSTTQIEMRLILPRTASVGAIAYYSTIGNDQSRFFPTSSYSSPHHGISSRGYASDRARIVLESSSSSSSSELEPETVLTETGDGTSSNPFGTIYHTPVMLRECIDSLLECPRSRIRREEDGTSTIDGPLIFVDGTLGGGGHSAALLQQLQPGDIVFGCDVDPKALETASQRLEAYMIEPQSVVEEEEEEEEEGKIDHPIFIPVKSNFCDLASILPTILHPGTQRPILQFETDGQVGVDGILLDLGVSSHQIDTPNRGFAFMKDGPLDMRMGAESNSDKSGLTAADICNEFDQDELQRILSVYGDEPRAKTIAKTIVENRPIETTGKLVEAVSAVTPRFAKKSKRMGRTATLARVFQSLRIVVNNEDGVLDKAFSEMCPAILRPGGRLVVLSYHSMEDRAAKRIIRDGTLKKKKRNDERDIYGNYSGPPKPFKPIGKRQKATKGEVDANPRARSATLRVGERLES